MLTEQLSDFITPACLISVQSSGSSVTTLLAGLSINLLASFIFIFYLLYFLRPRIKISPQIAKTKLDGADIYIFKVVNLSLFSAYDIFVDLWALESYPVTGGRNNKYIGLTLARSKLNYVEKYKWFWKKKKYGDFAMLFVTRDNLESILSNHLTSIQIQVTLRHGLSGLSKVYHMEYSNDRVIKTGDFAFGNNLNIA